jgi:putative ATPase
MIRLNDKLAAAQTIATLLKKDGRLVIAENIPRHTQRLHQLVNLAGLPAALANTVAAAEEAIYANPDDPMVNWDEMHLKQIFLEAGLTNINVFSETSTAEWRIGRNQIERWFNVTGSGDRLTFAQHLQHAGLTSEDLNQIKTTFQNQLGNKIVPWKSQIAYLTTLL